MKTERPTSLFPAVVALTVLSLGSFAAAALGSPLRRARYTPLVSVHAVLMTAWLVLHCVQARLADRGTLHLHRRLGRASGILVAVLVPLSILVAFDFHREFERTVTLVADLGLLATFLPLYLGSIWFATRGRIDIHKRLMLVATIALVSPALGRLTAVLGWPRPLSFPLWLLLLIGIPLAYDLRSRGGPHRASVLAVGYSLLTLVAVMITAAATGSR